MANDTAITNPNPTGALSDGEAFDTVDTKYGWSGGNFDRVTIPTTEGGLFVYKESGKKVESIAFKIATAYWKRFYSVQDVNICYCNNAKLLKGMRLQQDGTTRKEVECVECPYNQQPKTCKPSYVIEWDEGDDAESVKRVRMYLSWSAQKEFGSYSQKLQDAGLDVRNVITIMKSKKGSTDVKGKGKTEYFYATFEMQDAKAGLDLVYNTLTEEQKTKVGDYMKKAFNVDTVDKLNDVQREMLTQEVQRLSKESVKATQKPKTPF